MRQLVYILLALMAAGSVACHRTPDETEARLIAIDSLIGTAPDSALVLLEKISPSEADGAGETIAREDASRQKLHYTAGDRAYHALLTCQAMWKAYIPATSDSLINLAWGYYKDHGPYDRRIRAMLYKGTTAEELGHPDSAMRWYKRTEQFANSNDYFYKGMALISMAFLYQQQYLAKKEAIAKFQSAYYYFRLCNDNKYALYCLTFIGANYLILNNDSSYFYAKESLKIANRIKDSISICQSIETLMGYYYLKKNWPKVKQHASYLIKNGFDNQIQSSMLFAATSHYHLNEFDSATDIIKKIDFPLKTAKDSILYYETKALIEKRSGHIINSYNSTILANKITSEKVISNKKSALLLTEKESIAKVTEDRYKIAKKNNLFLMISLLLFLFVVIIASLFVTNRHKQLNERIRTIQESLTFELEQLKASSNSKESGKYDNQELIDLKSACINVIFQNTIYSGVRGASIFKYIFDIEKIEKKSLISIDLPQSFWRKLEEYISKKYPYAFERLKDDGISLNSKEQKLIMLDCIGIPNAVISIILGYSERSTASVRYRILNKIGCNVKNFDDILNTKSNLSTVC